MAEGPMPEPFHVVMRGGGPMDGERVFYDGVTKYDGEHTISWPLPEVFRLPALFLGSYAKVRNSESSDILIVRQVRGAVYEWRPES